MTIKFISSNLQLVYRFDCQECTSTIVKRHKHYSEWRRCVTKRYKKISLEKIFKDVDFRNKPTAIFIRPTDTVCWNATSSYFDRRRQKLESTCRETPFAATVLCIKANALLGFAPDDIFPVAASLQARKYHEEARWEEPSTMCLWGIFFRLSRIFFTRASSPSRNRFQVNISRKAAFLFIHRKFLWSI